MPKEKVKGYKTERVVIREPFERGMIDKGVDEYRDENHSVYDFLRDFFGVCSSKPSGCLSKIKSGNTSVSSEGWDRMVEYVSERRGK